MEDTTDESYEHRVLQKLNEIANTLVSIERSASATAKALTEIEKRLAHAQRPLPMMSAFPQKDL